MSRLSLSILVFLAACSSQERPTTGSIERMDPELDTLISPGARIEVLADGYNWVEGPVWDESRKMLLYSDIPANRIYKWTEDSGARVWLEPSGYTGQQKRGGEEGSNALLINQAGQLVICQHGDRRIALMDASLDLPQPRFITLADRYEGQRLNSPNDITQRNNGDLYFTDPPYGLEKQAADPSKELPFQGVYRISGGQLQLLLDSLTRPNGIGFLPGDSTLIIANSDSAKAAWYLYDIDARDSLVNGRVLMDVTNQAGGLKGLPDGLKVDKKGNIFATGPGGVFIFDAGGRQIGKIHLPEACSNIALADGDRTLYMTEDMNLLRLRMR